MDNQVMVAGSEMEKAQALHMEIMANARVAADALVAFMVKLKEMRDTGLYKQLGFDSFEQYTEEKAGIKGRMAYYYISTLEKLGPRFVEENSELGITKLRLLSEVAPLERDDFIDSNDLDGMSVEEIRAAVAKAKDLGEQLELVSGELEEARNTLHDTERQLEQARDEVNGPAESGTMTEEELENLKDELRKEAHEIIWAEAEAEKAEAVKAAAKEAKEKAKAAAEKELEKVRDEALKKGADEAKREMGGQLERLAAEKQAAAERAAALEKELGLAASTESAEFALWFEQLGHAAEKMLALAEQLRQKGKEEEAAKYLAALAKALGAVMERALHPSAEV